MSVQNGKKSEMPLLSPEKFHKLPNSDAPVTDMILLLHRHAIISTDILLNFRPICCKLIDLTINNMINFFLALGYKLLED